MKIVGITGGSGSGKTTCLNIFRELGAYTIDCDALYHDLLRNSAELLSELSAVFPGAFDGGALDRKKLGADVFSNPERLEILNGITHKYVKLQVCRAIDAERARSREIFAIDAILLIESGLGDLCDKIIGVIAPINLRCERIMARDGLSSEYATARIEAQKDDGFFEKHCNYILDGGAPKNDFICECRRLFNQISNKATGKEQNT